MSENEDKTAEDPEFQASLEAMKNCPLLKWQDTVNGTPLEILECVPGMIRAAAHKCGMTAFFGSKVKVAKEATYRSDAKVNKTDDMVRVTMDMHRNVWREMKDRLGL